MWVDIFAVGVGIGVCMVLRIGKLLVLYDTALDLLL